MFCLSAWLLICAESIKLECEYNISWNVVIDSYYCKAHNILNINSYDEAFIDSVEDVPTDFEDRSLVEGFYALNNTINYFPRQLDKFFKNLKYIGIEMSQLKEIHQSDLKPFTKLLQLNLYENQLEVINKNLFAFNLNLKYVSFANNKISFIDSNVFDNLINLRFLFLRSNECINMDAENDSTEVQKVIKEAQEKCVKPDSDEKIIKQMQMPDSDENHEDDNKSSGSTIEEILLHYFRYLYIAIG